MRLRDYFSGLDMLARVSARVSEGFSVDMPREAAKAHFDARALLLNLRWKLADEAETAYDKQVSA